MIRGVLNRYSRVILGAAAGGLILAAALALYFQYRGPIGDRTPYHISVDPTVRDLITMETEYPVYDPDTWEIRVRITNQAAEPLTPAENRKNEWALEIRRNGIWHSVRSYGGALCWEFPQEEYGQEEAYGESLRPSGTVQGGGGTLTYLCELWAYYSVPLDDPALNPGHYRIVFPGMKLRDTRDLSVEFDIRDLTEEEQAAREAEMHNGFMDAGTGTVDSGI